MARRWEDMMRTRRVYAKQEAIEMQQRSDELYTSSRSLRRTGHLTASEVVAIAAARAAAASRECLRTVLGIYYDDD